MILLTTIPDKPSTPIWVLYIGMFGPFVFVGLLFFIKSRRVSKKLLIKYEKLVDLAICILQVNDKITSTEIKTVHKYITQKFNKKKANKLKAYFKDSINKNRNINEVLKSLSFKDMIYIKDMNVDRMDIESTYFSFLVKLSISDRFLSKKELETLQIIRRYWRISDKSFNSILAMYNFVSEEEINRKKDKTRTPSRKLTQAYKILEIDINASIDDIKQNYRRLIKQYHPDKLRGVNEFEKKQAKEMFLKVQKAYELIQNEKKF